MLRGLVKTSIAAALHRTGADTMVRSLRGSDRLPVVVGYHRVVDDLRQYRETTIPALLISRTMLERHLDWIGRRFRVVSGAELEAWLDGGADVSRPVATITFDDGYRDVYEHAVPLLKRKGMPAIVFVVSDLVGTARVLLHDRLYLALARTSGSAAPWRALHRALAAAGASPTEGTTSSAASPFTATRRVLDRLRQADVQSLVDTLEAEVGVDEAALEAMRPLSWEMLADMQRHGITVGAHTRTHPVLTNETPTVVSEETAGSRKHLESRLGVAVHHFAYPDGGFDRTAVKAVAAAGYRLAFTACRHRDSDYPGLTLPRTLLWERSSVDAWQRFSASILSCQLRGMFDVVRSCRRPHGGAD